MLRLRVSNYRCRVGELVTYACVRNSAPTVFKTVPRKAIVKLVDVLVDCVAMYCIGFSKLLQTIAAIGGWKQRFRAGLKSKKCYVQAVDGV